MNISHPITRLVAMSVGLVTLAISPISTASAETSKKDLQVASKALNFMVPKISGSAEVAVVFDPSNAISSTEADQIMAIIGDGLKVGKITLTARKVSAADLSFGGAKMVILTSGAGNVQSAVKAASDNAGLITVSTDESCVQSGNCVMGVKSSPKVKITINLSATTAANIKFSPAFQMMVNKI